jgi:hypothetical protein
MLAIQQELPFFFVHMDETSFVLLRFHVIVYLHVISMKVGAVGFLSR